jgi:hypothetical protein
MAQTTFEKTMRNVSVSDTPRERPQRYQRNSWQFEVNIPHFEHTTLRSYMTLELEYYNTLLSGFSSRLRTTPESILEAVEIIEKLFAQCAFSGQNIYKLSMVNDGVLPEGFEPFRDFIFSKDASGKRFFTDRIAVLCDMASVRAGIHPEVRRRIAVEMLTFFRTQVKVSLQAVPSHLRHDQLYKSPPESLDAMDIIRKRHLQIPKSIIKVTWDAESEQTIFNLPYVKTPLAVPSINFADEMRKWNYCILHQAPGSIALGKTPWVLDIRQITGNYLLKYTDVRNTNSAFAQAKRGIQRH